MQQIPDIPWGFIIFIFGVSIAAIAIGWRAMPYMEKTEDNLLQRLPSLIGQGVFGLLIGLLFLLLKLLKDKF